jgi:hypothetical protein
MQTRLELGDTDSSDPLITDEELDYLLTSEGDPLHAALMAAQSLAAKYGRQVDYQQPNDISESQSQRSEAFAAIADRLERRISRNASPYAGGVTIADVEAHRTDTGIVQPYFESGEDEEEGIWPDAYVPPDEVVPI